jgi:hypothetical protein
VNSLYIVEVIYGMEYYQQKKKEFSEYAEASDFYNDCIRENPISVRLYQLIHKYDME